MLQSAASVRRQTAVGQSSMTNSGLQSAASVRRQTGRGVCVALFIDVTIRCLRAEADAHAGGQPERRRVTIRCLRAEADAGKKDLDHGKLSYNPLPPCGGRHKQSILRQLLDSYNPLPPCGGRLRKSIIFPPNYHFLHCEIKLFYSLSPFP